MALIYFLFLFLFYTGAFLSYFLSLLILSEVCVWAIYSQALFIVLLHSLFIFTLYHFSITVCTCTIDFTPVLIEVDFLITKSE